MNGEISHKYNRRNYSDFPKHKSKFDVTSGKVVSGPKMLLFHPKITDEPSFSVKTENDDILIKM